MANLHHVQILADSSKLTLKKKMTIRTESSGQAALLKLTASNGKHCHPFGALFCCVLLRVTCFTVPVLQCSAVISCFLPLCLSVLGAFEELQKATVIDSSLSFCPSVCPHETTGLQLDGFLCNFLFEEFSKICEENSSFLTI